MAYWSAVASVAQAAHLFHVPDRALELCLQPQYSLVILGFVQESSNLTWKAGMPK